MDHVDFSIADAASVEAQAAMRQYFDELDARFAGGFDGDAALAEAPDSLNSPHGLFVLATVDGATVACGGVQFVDDHAGEIKRMWVSADARGMGLGKRMLAELEARAVASGRTHVVLDTNRVLAEAIAMYRSLGYRDIERYNDNPYAHHWFAKDLALPPGDESETMPR